MLNVEIDDKLVKISDDNLSKAKINSIKLVVDRYQIKDILDFRLRFKEHLFDFAEKYADEVLSEPVSIDEFFGILTEIFENIEKANPEEIGDLIISFEALFIS